MVVFDSFAAPTAFPGTPFLDVPPGGAKTVATVPADRWLIITDYHQQLGGGVDLVEDADGVITVKRHEMIESNNQDRFHSSVGLSFAPGSKVVLRSRSTNTAQMSYHLAGYWVAR